MEETLDKPRKKKVKEKSKSTIGIYYYILFTCIIIIEIFLIYNSSEKCSKQKVLMKKKLSTIINKKNNISNLLNQIEKHKQDIKDIKMNKIPSNNNTLLLYELEQKNLIIQNNNLSKTFHKSFEEYESRKSIFDFEIKEKNDTIKELYTQLNAKIILRSNLEDELDLLENKLTGDIPNISIKSKILENDEKYQNLLNKWISGLGEGEIKKYKLIFNAEEHDFDSFSFHEVCGDENIENTLIIIKTDNNDIIGGFTFASWRANSLISYDDKAFLFNLNKEIKIRVTSPSYAINSRINDGPIFGMCDLIINLDKLKVQEKMGSYGDKNLGLSSEVINIINYEVFTVIFK
jgi:hypothetical protein